MKNASKFTIGTIIIGIGVALISCFSFIKLIVLQPETTLMVNPPTNIQNVDSRLIRTNDDDIINLSFNNQIVKATIARSPEKTEKGLMNVTELNADEGMLFVFDGLKPRTFWMKDTLISLDIIYLDQNLRVVNMYDNTAPNQTTVVYSSQLPSSYVLEVNGGTAKRLGLTIGDYFSI
ncbi:MAG: DUF192 domain-containing protein [Candidatus Dojkabacteria bacterium]